MRNRVKCGAFYVCFVVVLSSVMYSCGNKNGTASNDKTGTPGATAQGVNNGTNNDMNGDANKPGQAVPVDFGNIALANKALMEGDYKKANELIDVILKAIPEDSFACRTKGDILVKQKNYSEAKIYFDKAINSGKGGDNSGWGYLELGKMYSESGDHAKAVEALKKASDILPKDEIIKKLLDAEKKK